MKASRLGVLSIALVAFGLAACPGPTNPIVDPPDPPPSNSGGGGSGGGGSGGEGPIIDPPDAPPLGSPPTGTFSVSESLDGTFTSDAGENITSDDDPRIISVAPSDTFYAQVAYAADSTITDVDLLLVNSAPAGLSGTLSPGTDVNGFTLGDPVGDCEVGSSATITCVYPITVGSDVEDIEELEGSDDEFAYVFRVEVTDSEGDVNGISTRGYVNIE